MRIGSLCSGIGGLELGLERAGLGHTVWQAEIDPHASQVLARHWPGVPNLGDFRDQPLPDCDVLIGGFPCQPVSSAGRRRGTEDERWLFDDIVDAVGRMGTPPRLFVFENVRGLLSANGGDAMARVVHGLAGLGLVGRYGLLRAADVGAPHRRERVFIVAADSSGATNRPDLSAGLLGGEGPGRNASNHGDRLGHGGGATVADAEVAERRATRHDPVATATRPAAEPGERHRPDTDWGPYAAAVARWEHHTRPAPAPTSEGRLNPAFVEWMMGFPESWTDGLTRTAALRCLGNAVVPQVAELLGRMIVGSPVAASADAGPLLPTPRTSDTNGAGHHGTGGADLRTVIAGMAAA